MDARREIETVRAAMNRRLDALAALLAETDTEDDAAEAVCLTLDQLATALAALRTPKAANELMSAVADVFNGYFMRVVVGAAEGDGFTVWHSRGFDPPLPAKTVLRTPGDSALARACAAWNTANGHDPDGIVGLPTRYAIALPLVAKGRGNAMVYAENPPGARLDERVAARIAELLADNIRPRLRIKAAAAPSSDEQTKQRRARRVRMADGTSVVVDQSEGQLVDLSTLGAQVVSRYAIEPNTAIRLVLPHDVGGLACHARVIWVVVERHPATQSARYRAGVQFTDVKSGELEGYLEFFEPGITH